MDINQKKDLLRVLQEKELIDQSKLANFQGNLIQTAFLLSNAKVRIVEGGNRSGKTEGCAVDVLVRMTGIIPKYLRDTFRKFIPISRAWVSSLSYPFSRDVAKPKMDKYIPEYLYDKYKVADSTFLLKGNKQIGLKSQDAGRDAYAGDTRDIIWMDEEHSEEVYKEAYMRTIDCEGRIVMSFTPVDGLTWAYDKLYKKAKRYYSTVNIHGLPEEVGYIHTPEEIDKLKERKLIVRENTDPDVDENIEVFQMTIYDNAYLASSEIHNAERENKDNIAGYQARILGIFAKITGHQVYPVELILKGKARCPSTFERGEIENGAFVPRIDGHLILFKKKKALGEGFYIAGADISEGTEQGDFSCINILDHHTCEQVAIWKGRVSPEEVARILINIGRYFNYAILAPERNFHGYGVVNQIRDQKYPKLFCDSDPSLYTDGPSERMKYGWETNAKTKPLMVQDLGRFLSEGHIKINDPNTWDELLTFVYDKNGRMGALKGCHDDSAISLMIALQVFIKRRPTPLKIYSPLKPTTPDKYTGY